MTSRTSLAYYCLLLVFENPFSLSEIQQNQSKFQNHSAIGKVTDGYCLYSVFGGQRELIYTH